MNDTVAAALEQNETDSVILVNRVADIPISRRVKSRSSRKKTSTDSSSRNRNITDQAYLDYRALNWWNPGLIASGMFACSTVISFFRLFPYVVLSDVTGPLQISIGSMVKGTLHFFLVVAVVVLAFSIGLTYIYAYYDSETVKDQVCIEDDNLVYRCRKGTLAK